MVWTVRSHFVSLRSLASKSALKIQLRLGSYRWLTKSFLTSPLWESVCWAQRSDYQINFSARKGETIITEKNAAKSQKQNCTDYEANCKFRLESAAAPINFQFLSFAVYSSETWVFTLANIKNVQQLGVGNLLRNWSQLWKKKATDICLVQESAYLLSSIISIKTLLVFDFSLSVNTLWREAKKVNTFNFWSKADFVTIVK